VVAGVSVVDVPSGAGGVVVSPVGGVVAAGVVAAGGFADGSGAGVGALAHPAPRIVSVRREMSKRFIGDMFIAYSSHKTRSLNTVETLGTEGLTVFSTSIKMLARYKLITSFFVPSILTATGRDGEKQVKIGSNIVRNMFGNLHRPRG